LPFDRLSKNSILCVVGARPNFVKIAPIIAALRKPPVGIPACLIHTGQHYDVEMNSSFFAELGIPEPDANLEVGSGSHAVQTAEIMKAFEPVVLDHQPDAVLVVGDVNSTIACGTVAVKLGVKLIHVEAGLRSFDRTMPEEINRLITDAISDLLFCTEQSGVDNLRREGVPEDKIHFVGNVMIDTLLKHRAKAEQSAILEELALTEGSYAVITLHRPANVDNRESLEGLTKALECIQNDMTVVFPAHPRTRAKFEEFGMGDRLAAMSNLRILDPMGYLDFLKLLASARVVLTDSGGTQEETTILKVPCLTLRENTERPITLEVGSNRLVGSDPAKIISAYRDITTGKASDSEIPPLWDGHAAERIVDVLQRELNRG